MSLTIDHSTRNTHINDNDPLDDRYMALEGIVISDHAKMLVSGITDDVSAIMAVGHRKSLNDAVGAIVADLMACAASNPYRFSFRPVGNNDFTGIVIGRRPFRKAVEGLQRLKLLEWQVGFYKRDGSGQSSRFRGNSAFFARGAEAGVLPSEWKQHFSYRSRSAKVPSPIMLRAKRRPGSKAEHGRKMTFDQADPAVVAARQQVERINTFFATVEIENAELRGFRRIFGAGDDPAFNWNMGGRLYALGGGYQELSAEERAAIRLNGEATIELDIKSSHLTIVRQILGYGRVDDPYHVPGIDRDVSKQWVTMALGNGKFHQNWSDTACRRFLYKRGIDLKKAFPYKATSKIMKAHLPEVGETLERGIIWGPLQYIESCAIIDAVDILATEYGIPALPVHDSLIVPASKEGRVRSVLTETFKRYAGVEPVLEIK